MLRAIYILYSIQIYFRGDGYKEIQTRTSFKVTVVLNQNECKVSPLLSFLSPVPKPNQKAVINFWDNTLWLTRRHFFSHWIFRINGIMECCRKCRIILQAAAYQYSCKEPWTLQNEWMKCSHACSQCVNSCAPHYRDVIPSICALRQVSLQF